MSKHLAYIAIAAFFLLLGSCMSDEEKGKVMNERINLPTETGRNVYITYTDSGYAKAKIFAPIMERYTSDERSETVMRKGITAYFYNKNRKVDSYLKSKYAIRNDHEKRMIARNDVILVNNKGDTLSTEELIWEESTQMIHSDKYVKITTPTEIIMGDGFESNTEFTKYKITHFRGTISLHK
jgi:LPS export ABC transporter protein LptC